MIVVISFIINLFAPIVNPLGLLGLLYVFTQGDVEVLIGSAALAVVGFVYGIIAYHNDVPPRWFWSKSASSLFEFSVTAVLGYTWSFAAWPFAIYIVDLIISKI